MSKVIQAYGVPSLAPHDLSTQLSELGISHSLHTMDRRYQTPYIKHVAVEQPYWVAVMSTIESLRTLQPKQPNIVFVCGSMARLQCCNVGLLPFMRNDQDSKNVVMEALEYAVKNPISGGWVFKEHRPSIDDFVNLATNPSFLNFMETARNKINPYEFRKAIHPVLIAYLDGRLSQRKLFQKLRESHRYEKLLEVMKEPGALNLRNAVAYFKANTVESEVVGNLFGIDSFDINYVVKASSPKG